jgi:hypothetical protein
MSYVKPADRERKAGEEGEGGVAPTHRIRITLTSTKVLRRGADQGGPACMLLPPPGHPWTCLPDLPPDFLAFPGPAVPGQEPGER